MAAVIPDTTVPTTYSHSRLTTLDDCPRRYRYRYVDKLPEGFQTVEAFMGTLVHEALQWLYLEREGKREPTEDELVEKYRASWTAGMGPRVRVVQEGLLAEGFRDDGEEMLRRHHATRFKADRRATLAIEPRITLALGGHAYTGYIDRLARDTAGTLHVIDFKTGRRMPASAAEAGLQVRGYGLAVLETHGGLEVELSYEFLRHGLSLDETLPRSRSAEVAAALTARIEGALAAELAAEFPARPGLLCRWCGYRDTCDASSTRGVAVAAGAAAAPLGDDQTTCPRCGSGLRLRSGSRAEFVSCERYPECRHVRDVRSRDRGVLGAPGTMPARPAAPSAPAAESPQLVALDEADLEDPS